MALVQTTLKSSELILRAPGMLAAARRPRPGRGARPRSRSGTTASPPSTWARCARSGSAISSAGRCAWRASIPRRRRLADRKWTGAIEAENAFQDGFPLLVASTASLAEVNRRLALRRPDAGDAGALSPQPRPRRPRRATARTTSTRSSSPRAEGPVRLKLVKPCVRCSIPDVDPATGDRRPRRRRRARAVPRRPAHGRRAHLRDERGRRRRHRPHAARRACAAGRATPSPEGRRADASLQDLAAVRDLRRRLGNDLARDHLPALRLLRRGRRRASLRPRRRRRARPLPLARRAARAIRSPTTARSRCRASSSTASRTSASITPSASSPRGWSRSATRRRRSSPASARRSSSAPRSAGASSSAACSACAASSSSSGPRSRAPSGGERGHARRAASPSRRCCSRPSAA